MMSTCDASMEMRFELLPEVDPIYIRGNGCQSVIGIETSEIGKSPLTRSEYFLSRKVLLTNLGGNLWCSVLGKVL
jgi:hypothetical protein